MRLIITTFLLSFLFPTRHDIIMRHDVDEAKYFALAEKYAGTVVHLKVGCGTLVGSKYIVTAAHVAEVPQLGDEVEIDGKVYTFKRKLIHPDFDERRSIVHDIALIELNEPVTGRPFAKLYDKQDEVGKEIIFAGTGYAGTGDKGLDGKVNRDRKMRAAQNKVDGTRQGGFISFTFDAPGSKDAMPLEGISGPGDSGGPALWFDGDQAYIIGVSSHQDFNGNSAEGMYGAREFYTRVSTHRVWLTKEMANH